jgi:hypothetical protein
MGNIRRNPTPTGRIRAYRRSEMPHTPAKSPPRKFVLVHHSLGLIASNGEVWFEVAHLPSNRKITCLNPFSFCEQPHERSVASRKLIHYHNFLIKPALIRVHQRLRICELPVNLLSPRASSEPPRQKRTPCLLTFANS